MKKRAYMQPDPQHESYRLDETLNATPNNTWAILLVVCRPMPPTWSPLKSLSSVMTSNCIGQTTTDSATKAWHLFCSPGGMLCVSAFIGWCRSQNNILSWSVPVVFTLCFFLSLKHRSSRTQLKWGWSGWDQPRLKSGWNRFNWGERSKSTLNLTALIALHFVWSDDIVIAINMN